MKTILILTDFSENATHAAQSATIFVEKLRTNILLYHSCYDSPVIPAYAGGPMVVDEFSLVEKRSRIKLNKLALDLRHIVMDLSEHGYRLAIDYQYGEGSLGKNVSEILERKDVEMIVMGSSADSTIHNVFFGSDTLSVIEDATCPVLIVPAKAELKKIQKITLATAFELADINVITYMIELCKVLNCELEIVHISLHGESENPAKGEAFHTHINAIKQSNLSYQEVRGKDVVTRLNDLCKENGSDILALVHHKHGFFSNIFRKSTVEKALKLNHRIPLMVIPAEI